MARRNWLIWCLAFIGWMVMGLSFSVNDYLSVDSLAKYYATRPTLGSMLLWDLAYWPTWAVLAPLIYWQARRFPLSRANRPRNLTIHLVIGLLLVVPQRAVYLTIAWALQNLAGERLPLLSLYHDFLLYNLPTGLMSYVVLLGGFLLYFNHEYQQERVYTARLRAELNHAQLQALRMQLQPHFLFNTFNSISAMLHEDPHAADEMLAQLGDFLRVTLQNSGQQMVPLEVELDFLRRYLSIEQIRLQNRLQIDYDIETSAKDALVPNLLLQPIIENVIKHEVGQTYDPVRVAVAARIEGGRLHLSVSDDGPGLSGNGMHTTEGFGLSNTRARLRSAFNDDFRFDLVPGKHGGTVAAMEMPVRKDGVAAVEVTA